MFSSRPYHLLATHRSHGSGWRQYISKKKEILCLLILLGIVLAAYACLSFSFIRFSKKIASPGDAGYVRQQPCTIEDPCDFLLIADLDESSRIEGSSLKFHSYFLPGRIWTDEKGIYNISFGEERVLEGNYNAGGRGFELSELIYFNGDLLTFDDRTGIVYKYISKSFDGRISPLYVISDGDGTSDNGMKIEWATVKDGELWMGSFGKEYTDDYGKVLHDRTLWVVSISTQGKLTRHYWREQYEAVRSALNIDPPGYLMHEAIGWSSMNRSWVVLPRRVSSFRYSSDDDEFRGSNLMIIASEDFKKFKVLEVGKVTPERGFSSFKFVPGTQQQVIFAIKSMEDSTQKTQGSFASVFTIDGTILMEEFTIPTNRKYEGVEFVG